MGNTALCGESQAEAHPVLSGGVPVRPNTREAFNLVIKKAKSHHDVITVVKSVLEPAVTEDQQRLLRLTGKDWQDALRAAGPHADMLLRGIEDSTAHEHELDEGCYHVVVISLVQLAMKAPDIESATRLLEDALGVTLTMEQRKLNQGVAKAYQAVEHAANVMKCPEIIEHVERLRRQHRANAPLDKLSPAYAVAHNLHAHNPPPKLNLDHDHFVSQSAPQQPSDSFGRPASPSSMYTTHSPMPPPSPGAPPFPPGDLPLEQDPGEDQGSSAELVAAPNRVWE